MEAGVDAAKPRITGNEISARPEGPTREEIKRYAQERGVIGEHVNQPTGERWTVGGRTLTQTLSKSQRDPDTRRAIAALPETLKIARFVEDLPLRPENSSEERFRRFRAPVEIGGQTYRADILVRTQRNQLRSGEVVRVEYVHQQRVRKEEAPPGERFGGRESGPQVPASGASKQSIAQNPPEGKPATPENAKTADNPGTPGLLDRAEQAARERIKRRSLPGKPGERSGGAGIILENLADYAIIAAARVVKAGVRTVRALREAAASVLQESGEKYTAQDVAQVASRARAIVRDSGPDGADFERAVAKITEAKGPTRGRIKGLIARTTGMTDDADAKTISAREALAASMRAQVRAAREADRAARESAGRVLAAKMAEVRWNALTARNARQKAVRIVRRFAPPALVKRYLSFVARAKDAQSGTDLYARVSADLADYRLRIAKVEAAAALRAAKPNRLIADLREQVTEARKTQARLLADLETARDKATAARAEAAKLQDAAARADRLAEISGELVRTVNELREQLVTKVRNVAREARATQRHYDVIHSEGRKIAREVIAEEIVAKLAAMPDLKVADGESPGASLSQRALFSLFNRQTWADYVGGGRFGTLISQEIWDGETARRGLIYESRDAMRKIVEAEGLDWGSVELRGLSRAATGHWANDLTLDLPSGQSVSATPGEWMLIYAHLRDLDAREKILGGTPMVLSRLRDHMHEAMQTGRPDPGKVLTLRLNRDDAKFIERVLDPKLRKIVDKFQAWHRDRVRPDMEAAFLEHFGYSMPQHEGYIHTRRWKAEREKDQGLVGDYTPGAKSLGTVSIMRERSEGPGKAPYLIDDYFERIDKMVGDEGAVIYLNKAYRSFQALLRDERVQTELRRKTGREGFNELARVAEESAIILRPDDQLQMQGLLPRAADVIKTNLSVGWLSISPSATLKNVGGIGKLVAYMPAKYIRRAMAKPLVPGLAGADYREMIEASPYLRAKHDTGVAVAASALLGPTSEVLGPMRKRDALKSMVVGGDPGQIVPRVGWRSWRLRYRMFHQLVSRLPFFNWGDSRPSVVAWRAAKLMVEDQHPDWTPEAKTAWAAREAERVIRLSQQPMSQIDGSGLQKRYARAPVSLLLMFRSDGIQSMNMILQAMIKAGWNANQDPRGFLARTTDRQTQRVAGAVAINMAVASAVTTVLVPGVYKLFAALFDNEDDAEYAKNRRGLVETFLREMALNTAGLVWFGPEVFEATEAVVDSFRGAPARQIDVSISPAGQAFGTLAGATIDMIRAYMDEPETERERADRADRLFKHLERAITNGAVLAGVPLVPLYSLGKRARRGATDLADPQNVYESVASSIATGEMDAASDVLALLVRQRPPEERGKAWQSAMSALRRRGPDGKLSEAERVRVWLELPPAERAARAKAYMEWRRQVARVSAEAVRKSAAARSK